MTVTIVGFQGTISDYAMAQQSPANNQAPMVASAADLAVTAVSNARSVSVAPGSGDHAFVKYTSDSAQTLALAAPNSGGKWYLIAIDREWSPTNTATLVALDTGYSDTQGYTSFSNTIWEQALAAAAAILKNSPGTAGSTVASGAHQPLALVYVIAASTTLQVVDLRGVRTGAGMAEYQSLHGLAFAAAVNHLREGGVASVGPHTLYNGGYHVSSTWRRETTLAAGNAGYSCSTFPVGRIIVDSSVGSPASTPLGQIVATLASMSTYLPNAIGLRINETEALDQSNTITPPGAINNTTTSRLLYRYARGAITGSGTHGNVAFQPWSSEWVAYQVTTYSMSWSNYTNACWWRYAEGEVEVKFYGLLASGGLPSGRSSITMPVTQQNGGGTQGYNGDDYAGVGHHVHNGDNSYGLRFYFCNVNQVYLDTMQTVTKNSKQVEQLCGIDANTPFTWANGDFQQGRVRYSPAPVTSPSA